MTQVSPQNGAWALHGAWALRGAWAVALSVVACSGGGEQAPAAGGSGGAGGGSGVDRVVLTGGASALTDERPALRGAFVQVTNAQDATYWARAVEYMSVLGMSDVIVQTEAWLTDAGALNAPTDDRLRAVLDGAEGHSMTVWMGLALPEYGNGSLAAAQDPAFIDAAIEASRASVDRVLERFGESRALGGWYLPLELWTPDAAGLGGLPRYVREVSAYAKAQRDLPVMLSPFISDLATDPAVTESTFAELLDGAAVDVVALQDGVGARSVAPAELSVRVTPYLRALAAACERAGCAAWANVESFAADSQPASYATFQAQVEAAQSVTLELVTYEFSTYWLGADGAPNELFEAYEAALPPSFQELVPVP